MLKINIMSKVFIPEGYKGAANKGEVHLTIPLIKSYFQSMLAGGLNLVEVQAPLFVERETGINDGLNGVEKAISFTPPHIGKELEIIHSLAKWKRVTLHEYNVSPGAGIVTNMKAIRQDEELSNIHSVFVDQWDWEKVLSEDERNEEYLRKVVTNIYYSIKSTEKYMNQLDSKLLPVLPDKISFITTQELEDMYPDMTPKQRENEICKEKGAIFLMQVGKKLKSGERHDGRAYDYDDWELNGDIIVWNPVLEQALELSSMGIRVDADALRKQALELGKEDQLHYPYHQSILDSSLPLTIGGGIGQSRLCMFVLKKAHIGEVQASIWDENTKRVCGERGVQLL